MLHTTLKHHARNDSVFKQVLAENKQAALNKINLSI